MTIQNSRRSLNKEQAKRLLMVLEDNGIEPDECVTVAEAICFVTDLDEAILEEIENEPAIKNASAYTGWLTEKSNQVKRDD